jgi:hypothetical protein
MTLIELGILWTLGALLVARWWYVITRTPTPRIGPPRAYRLPPLGTNQAIRTFTSAPPVHRTDSNTLYCPLEPQGAQPSQTWEPETDWLIRTARVGRPNGK